MSTKVTVDEMFVCYSAHEARQRNGAGFWCESLNSTPGWEQLEKATRYYPTEIGPINRNLSDGADAVWMKWPEALAKFGRKPQRVKVRVSLEMDVDLRGTDRDHLVAHLERLADELVKKGRATEWMQATVEDHSVHARVLPEPLDESTLAGFMARRIENGDVDLEDLPSRLARYGLMEPSAFIDEMQERMSEMPDAEEAGAIA